MKKEALIILTKNPKAGKVKTRLAATIGDERALAVYHQLLLHTASVTKCLPIDKFVFYSDYMVHEDVWENKCFHKEIQHGADLGERMKNAFTSVFQKGYTRIAIIGTDCPELNEELITSAFFLLPENDIVIGPAEDGGYYLLAMTHLHMKLFTNIQWSTSHVLMETVQICNTLELKYQFLPVLNDIDEENDLLKFNLKNK